MFSLKFTFSKYSSNQGKCILSELWTAECFQKVIMKYKLNVKTKKSRILPSIILGFKFLTAFLLFLQNNKFIEASQIKDRDSWSPGRTLLFLGWVGRHLFLCKYPIFTLSKLKSCKGWMEMTYTICIFRSTFFNVTKFNFNVTAFNFNVTTLWEPYVYTQITGQ